MFLRPMAPGGIRRRTIQPSGRMGIGLRRPRKLLAAYQVEFKIKKSALSDPQDGATLGFHIAINDDDGTLPSTKMQLGWSGLAHEEYTYGHLTLSGPVVGGKLTINNIKVSGNNLELSITTRQCLRHSRRSANREYCARAMGDVANVTFSSQTANIIVATFPKPSSSPAFYRATIR